MNQLAAIFPRRASAWLAVLLALSSVEVLAQSYTWRNVTTNGGGGYIPNIIFNPTQQNLIYARTDIGGAYRWNPTTNRWIPLMDWVGFDDWNTLGVESIATDPVDPQRVYVAAGTYTNSFTTSNGAILRSTDQGNTWSRTNLPFKLGGNMPGRNMGERLAIDPNNHAILYLGTRSGNGLWKSSDFGATWAKVMSFPQPGTYVVTPGDVYLGDIQGVTWVVFDKSSGTPGNTTQTIYVGVAQPFGSNIFRSTDGGTTWAAVPGEPTCTLTGSNVACSDGASWTIGSTAPNHPGSGLLPQHGKLSPNGILYVTYSDGAGPFDGSVGDVWKLNTATGGWTQIAPVLPTDNANDYFGYGGLAVDTLQPNTIMVSALNSWWPDTIFFRSTDAGATWTRIWDFTSYPSRSLRYVQDISAAPWLTMGDTNPQPPVPSPKLGWMVSGLEIDPFNSNHMLYGTGATLYGTSDLLNWDTGGQIHISVMAQGIEETAVLDLISPPSGATLLSALGDVNGYKHTDLTQPPSTIFITPTTASSTSIDFAELSSNFIVRVGNVDKSQSPQINRCGFSFDGGSNWFQGVEPGGVTGGGSVAAAADASRVVWSPDGSTVNFSANNGSSWTQSAGIPAGARVGSDRVNPMKFYGFANGTFYISTNGGVSFTAASTTGLPPSGTQVRFRAVAGHEGDVWLAGGSDSSSVYGLWHTTNGGASFTKLANVDKADTIGFGMPAPGQTYPALYTSAQIGGVRGIFRSDDAGATWVRINDDAHQYGSTNAAITGDPRVYGRVFVSTNGRGIIEGDISGTQTPDFGLSANPSSLTVNRGANGTSTITIARLNGFASAISFTASGLPGGVTAAFNPATTTSTGTSSVLTLAASSTATLGNATVTVTGTGGGLTHTATIAVTVASAPTPDFSLSASPATLTLNRGASATSTITITRTGGFTGTVNLTSGTLPAGVTATFNPAAVTGTTTTSTLTLAANTAASLGAATVTVTGTPTATPPSAHSTSIALTVQQVTPPDFSLSSAPSTLSVAQGSSGTNTITIARAGGFSGSVALTVSSTLPGGVTATFSPASTTGSSSVLTLAASATATAGGPTTVTITGTSGSLVHTATVALTVTATTTGTGGVTVTPVVGTNSPWFDDEELGITNTGTLTAFSVTIVVQRTTGVTFSGQFNTVGSQITQANSSTTAAVTYTFTLAAGQTLGATTMARTFAAQASGSGTAHPTTGDTYTVTYTTGGQNFKQTGHF